jgi:hypothetical protein
LIKKFLAASAFPLAVIVPVAATLGALGGSLAEMGIALAGVGSGGIVLNLLQPQRAGLTAPRVMLGLGMAGMLTGLAIDSARVPVTVLESLCSGNGELGFTDTLMRHAQMLPAMHLLMISGGLSAVPALRALRPQCRQLCAMLAQNTLCSGWMMMGMTAGALLFTMPLTSAAMSLPRMLGGMFAGMVWGMVVSVSAYRLFFMTIDKVRSRPAAPALHVNGKT